MQCPRCGGWHYGMGTPPKVNHRPEERWSPREAWHAIDEAMRYRPYPEPDPYDRDPRPNGNDQWHARVYGTDESGREVTAAFRREESEASYQALIADGHTPGMEFYGEDANGQRNHDHIGPGPHKDQFRGKYSGWDDFHD